MKILKSPKLFRVFKIFGRDVPALFLPNLLDQGTYGYYCPTEKYIAVDPDLRTTADLEPTLVHEMFHAVLDRLHCQQQMPTEFVEVVVENLTVALFDNYQLKFKPPKR